MGLAPSDRISNFVHSSGCQLDNTGPHPLPKQPHFAKLTRKMIKLKVRQNQNDFFKPTFPPKNERTNSTVLV